MFDFGENMRTATSLLICLFLINAVSPAVSGQVRDSKSWKSVEDLPKNSLVIISNRQSRRFVGVVRSVDDRSIELIQGQVVHSVRRSDVKTVHLAEWRNTGRARNRGALWGLFAGIAIAGLRESVSPTNAQDVTPGMIVAIGSISGAAIAKRRAAKPKRGKLVYAAGD